MFLYNIDFQNKRYNKKKQSDLEANGQTYKNKERSRNLHTNKHKKTKKE